MLLKTRYKHITLTVLLGVLLSACHTTHTIQSTAQPAAKPRTNSNYTPLSKKSPQSMDTHSNTSVTAPPPYRTSSVLDKYAVKLGVNKSDLKNAALYALIDEWYSVPYKWGGRTKAGVDCSDFAEIVLQQIYGIEIHGAVPDIYKHCQTIRKSELQEGDLVFFNIQGRPLSHVGVYLCNNKFVHASVRGGVIIEDLELPYYKRYFYKAGRINKE